MSRKTPKTISNLRFGSLCAHRAPIGAAQMLVERMGTELGRLDSELAKLAAASAGSPITAQIVREIVAPSLEATRAEGFPFKGVLYCGLMLTAEGPKTLEYNVRFGDPETQAILRRLDSDFGELALAVANGMLGRAKPVWSDETSTCVVMASAGYPGSYESGKVITGLDAAEQVESVVVFQAGTKLNSAGEIETAGGRVLGVTARAAALDEATARAYEAVEKIQFDGMQFRRDIGSK